jgi:gamma-glutamyltranspeptidase/glutathione hydrolase
VIAGARLRSTALKTLKVAWGLPFLWVVCTALAQQLPEPPSGLSTKQPVVGERFMVVAAHPLAVEAGYNIIRRGGTAIDAAVAVQLVLGLVEPQSSGLGGGTFIVHYAADGRVQAYDGRETAPRAATGERFIGADGAPLAFFDARLSGKAVGVPGTLAALELAQRAHGRLSWSELFAPAIALADDGFPISPRLHALLAGDRHLQRDHAARAYFYERDGRPKAVGTVLKNPAYAATLRRVAMNGAQALYGGEIARDVVAAVQANDGDMTLADMARYGAKERAALCGSFRVWHVCGMPPPSSGGVAVLELLGILERLPPTDFDRDPLQAVHRFSEAGRLSYADRDRYVADPDFIDIPVAGLLEPGYLAMRAALISDERSLGRVPPGRPTGSETLSRGAPEQFAEAGTTHFSIIDAAGNAVAVSSSIEFAFGNHTMVRGFLLNNELTDFALYPEQGGRPVANRAQGGKRPRSSMAPTLVFDEGGNLMMIAGSPGGQTIINFVARTLVAVLDWRMPLQAALDAPHFGSRNGPTELEAGTLLDELAAPLRALGHEVRIRPLTSGVHAILRTPQGWLGAADPRREGVARGD